MVLLPTSEHEVFEVHKKRAATTIITSLTRVMFMSLVNGKARPLGV